MKEIYLPIGLPGIGKSTVLNAMLANRTVTCISSDAIRKELTGDEGDISQDSKVWPLFQDRFQKALTSSDPGTDTIVLDSTSLKAYGRKTYFDMMRNAVAQGQQLLVKVLEFPLNAQLAIERQKNRTRQVPEDVIRRMAAKAHPFSLTETQGLQAEHIKIAEDGSTSRVA